MAKVRKLFIFLQIACPYERKKCLKIQFKMKKSEKFFHIAIPLIILAIIIAFFVNITTVLTVLFFLLLLIIYILYKEKIGQELIIALLISIAWTSYYFYEYTTPTLFLGKINLFTLASLTLGLVLLREIYERLKGKNRFIKISLVYIVSLLVVEYIGYNFLGIRLNSNFPGFLGLDLIHTPLSSQIFYLTVGPLYILITNYLKVK